MYVSNRVEGVNGTPSKAVELGDDDTPALPIGHSSQDFPKLGSRCVGSGPIELDMDYSEYAAERGSIVPDLLFL
jgi:hypothetical protein